MRYINEIIIHCTDTPPGREVSKAELDTWHQARGWRCCGYHYIVHLDGTVERGRPISQPGAHCYGHNAHSIGIVYVGGRSNTGDTDDTRTESQKSALRKLVWNLCKMYKCGVHGHREYNKNKACPCFSVQDEFANMAEKARKI